jgi:hypothetical protein
LRNPLKSEVDVAIIFSNRDILLLLNPALHQQLNFLAFKNSIIKDKNNFFFFDVPKL